jgi:hypothetical protein
MYVHQQGHVELVREIQKRKDELYDLIAKGERNCKTTSWWDAFLAVRLCKDVTPRPSDCDWYDIKRMHFSISYSSFVLAQEFIWPHLTLPAGAT